MTATERHTMRLQMEVVFRFANKSDLPKLEWYGEYTHFRRVFERAYEDQVAGRRLMLLADVNGWPIGQVFIQLAPPDDIFAVARKRGYLYSLRVMDAFRGQGIGTALLEEADRILLDRSYHLISIAAAKDNPGAQRLYQRMGYRIISEDPGSWHYIDHEGKTRHVVEPCYILEKLLR